MISLKTSAKISLTFFILVGMVVITSVFTFLINAQVGSAETMDIGLIVNVEVYDWFALMESGPGGGGGGEIDRVYPIKKVGDPYYPPEEPAVCPDGKCEPDKDETSQNCIEDCPSGKCGNGFCDMGSGETRINCPKDCGGYTCGDHKCDYNRGERGEGMGKSEDGTTCAKDCGTCGNKICEGPAEDRITCSQDCPSSTCGNGRCEDGEDEYLCYRDCGKSPDCGNDVCEANKYESIATCPKDCHGCGDGICDMNAGEANPSSSTYCFKDCSTPPVCGDGLCERNKEENEQNCNQDCNSCGNGVCEPAKGEDINTCLQDCKGIACGLDPNTLKQIYCDKGKGELWCCAGAGGHPYCSNEPCLKGGENP